ncbi:MAG: polyprenyl synthetase family protein [Faecalicoccus sp.]|nr:polyprenyl synthetase family protein [Faecalicoccus sp.]
MSDFEAYLLQEVNAGIPSLTREAMAYSLMNGGKRIRPQLLFSVLKDHGLPESLGYPAAAAIEMIHTYSLIHDDLPAMDNDDLRRGKPSCHKAFNEAAAILAGDGLLTLAFQEILKSDTDDTRRVYLVQKLSEYAGIEGMIYGQDQDMFSQTENADIELLKNIERYKTGKLLTIPLIAGCVLAHSESDLDKMLRIGENIGILFQVQDDILDVTKSAEELGKSNSDLENDKITACSLLGLDKAKEMVEQYEKMILEDISLLSYDAKELKGILDYLMKRNY